VRALVGAIALLLAACAAAEAPAAPGEAEVAPPPVEVVEEASSPPAPTTLSLRCAGAFTQGGLALCRTLPNAAVSLDGLAVGAADADGWIVLGFTREHGVLTQISASASGATVSERYDVTPRAFDIQRVDGLPQSTVTPSDPAVLARIQREAAVKQAGFQSTANIEGFLDGFIRPVEGGRVSGTWGNQRILNGMPSTPHFGYDIAVPAGTPIRAPAAGVVTLAEPDMHYEGGLVFIDHGQGLITMYLHMSRLDVHAGDTVEQGQVIGAVGASGRATGPHLCWRMKLRNTQQLDPSVAIEGLAEARRVLLSGGGQ